MKFAAHWLHAAPVHMLRQFGGDGVGIGAGVSGIGLPAGTGVHEGSQLGYVPLTLARQLEQSVLGSVPLGQMAHPGPCHELRQLQVHPVVALPDAMP